MRHIGELGRPTTDRPVTTMTDTIDPKAAFVIFWSWQSDSPNATNRNFVEKCLQAAAKSLSKETPVVITIDRDTRGVGGTPAIVDTVLRKILAADIFVWDATFVSLHPKPSPNPNVLFELGYAFAVLGEGRIIGVANTAGIPDNAPLPFDLNHRRWPIRYSLDPSSSDTSQVKESLTKDLIGAIGAALREPKGDVLRHDVDLQVALRLWKMVNSAWLQNWRDSQLNSPQYERETNVIRLQEYLFASEAPEARFRHVHLGQLHDALTGAIQNYLSTNARQRVPDRQSRDRQVISVKATDKWRDDYDDVYDRQVKALEDAAQRVWAAWEAYVDVLREYFPDVMDSST